MSGEIAIVGDIHGNLTALEEIVHTARNRAEVLVFVGDYVNRGPQSADVINFLVDLAASPGQTTFLRGNHEAAFLRYLNGGPVADFLKIGGAATLRSYASTDELLRQTDLRNLIPTAHIRFLGELRTYFREGELLVTHSATDPIPEELSDASIPIFRVAGHLPQAENQPSIQDGLALIDTGCGTWADGVLTCFFWPTADWIQAQ